MLKPKDQVRVREKSRKLEMFEIGGDAYEPPGYIEMDAENLAATLVRSPDREEVPEHCDERMVVEFYSR